MRSTDTAFDTCSVDARVTYDLDVVPQAGHLNLRRLGSALRKIGARVITFWDPDTEELHVESSDLSPQVFLDNPSLHLLTDAGRVDVLIAQGGFTDGYTGLVEHAEQETILGLRIQLASVADLITMKEAVGRPRDLADLDELHRIAKGR